jgi:hypothetical protein
MKSNQESAIGNQRSAIVFWLLVVNCWLVLSRFSL